MSQKKNKNEAEDAGASSVADPSTTDPSEFEGTEAATEAKNGDDAGTVEAELDHEERIAELEGKLQLARADMQNYRRQSEKRLVDSRRFIAKDLFLQILPIVDNFDAAMSALDKGQDAENVLIGVKMIHGMLGKLLEDNQVKRIDTTDAKFDADIHEAIGREETDEVDPNTITLEIQGGYRMGDLVLRPARVNVAAAPSDTEESNDEDS